MKKFTDTKEFISYVQACRKESKNKWFMGECFVGTNHVEYKFFNTWFQRLYIAGSSLRHSNTMDSKVGEMKAFLNELGLDSLRVYRS